jgi:hypothetical protein
MGGRISDLAVVESSPQVFFLGTATGGLQKTKNHGTSWTPLFDDQSTSSIGDVRLHQENPNLVWVGTANRRIASRPPGATASTGPRMVATPGLVERLNVLITARVPAFHSAMDDEGVRPDPGEALEIPRRSGG